MKNKAKVAYAMEKWLWELTDIKSYDRELDMNKLAIHSLKMKSSINVV